MQSKVILITGASSGSEEASHAPPAHSRVVVGNRGMRGASRFLLGSVPDKVSHHAPCSVLIVRTD